MNHFLDRAGDRHLCEIGYRSSLTFDFDLPYGAYLAGFVEGLGDDCKLEAK